MCQSFDIVIIPDELKLMNHWKKIGAHIVWFSQKKFSERLWNRKWVEYVTEVACPMCKKSKNEIIDETFLLCSSDSEQEHYQDIQINYITTILEWDIALIIYDSEFGKSTKLFSLGLL